MSPIEEPPLIAFTHPPSLHPLSLPPSHLLSSHPHIHHFMTGTLIFQSARDDEDPKILLLRRAPTDSYPLSWELPGGSADPSDLSVLSAAAREVWEETALVVARFVSCLGLLPAHMAPPEPEVQEWGIPPGEEEDPLEEIIFLPYDDIVVDDDEKTSQSGAIKLLTFKETNETWGKITLVAEVEDTSLVKTRPDEHVEFAWVTEREVLTGWLEGGEGEGEGEGGERGRRVLGFLSPAVRSQALEAFRLRREQRVECSV